MIHERIDRSARLRGDWQNPTTTAKSRRKQRTVTASAVVDAVTSSSFAAGVGSRLSSLAARSDGAADAVGGCNAGRRGALAASTERQLRTMIAPRNVICSAHSLLVDGAKALGIEFL
jgi:hypothetical protein